MNEIRIGSRVIIANNRNPYDGASGFVVDLSLQLDSYKSYKDEIRVDLDGRDSSLPDLYFNRYEIKLQKPPRIRKRK